MQCTSTLVLQMQIFHGNAFAMIEQFMMTILGIISYGTDDKVAQIPG